MNAKKTFYSAVTAIFLQLILAAAVAAQGAHLVLLPDTATKPKLASKDYKVKKDHYSGVASVQMALSSCPTKSQRHYNTQDRIFDKILDHNVEKKTWYSDPSGIEGALEDVTLTPCGNWVDFSNTDKMVVLSKMLYFMDRYRYLTPVSIGTSEHWVAVHGFVTTPQPVSSGTVTLEGVFFLDPRTQEKSVSSAWVTGKVWLNEVAYWGKPLAKPGSAWHDHYLAVIEPPEADLVVEVAEWIREGPIKAAEEIEGFFYRWLDETRETYYRHREEVGERESAGIFEALLEGDGIEIPILVAAALPVAGDRRDEEVRYVAPAEREDGYSYYLVALRDPRLIAVFNAYDGSFEELRFFEEPQERILEPGHAVEVLVDALRRSGVEILDMSAPALVYREGLSPEGRSAPTWEVEAWVRDPELGERQALLHLDLGGEIVDGPSPETPEIAR